MSKKIFIIKNQSSDKHRPVQYVFCTYNRRESKNQDWWRYVETTKYIRSAKQYESIAAANAEIAEFKKVNIFTNWKVVLKKIESNQTQVTV